MFAIVSLNILCLSLHVLKMVETCCAAIERTSSSIRLNHTSTAVRNHVCYLKWPAAHYEETSCVLSVIMLEQRCSSRNIREPDSVKHG